MNESFFFSVGHELFQTIDFTPFKQKIFVFANVDGRTCCLQLVHNRIIIQIDLCKSDLQFSGGTQHTTKLFCLNQPLSMKIYECPEVVSH